MNKFLKSFYLFPADLKSYSVLLLTSAHFVMYFRLNKKADSLEESAFYCVN